MSDHRDFEKAVENLSSLLAGRSLPTSIRWLFADDVCLVGETLFVKRALPAENTDLIERLFLSEPADRLGIEVCLIGVCSEVAYCSVLVPSDEDVAAELMIRGVKYRIPDRLFRCEVIGLFGWLVRQPFRRKGVFPVWGLPERGR